MKTRKHRDIGLGGYALPDHNPFSPEEHLCGARAQDIFNESPDNSLSGTGLYSAESVPGWGRTTSVIEYVTDEPDRFLSLVAHLTPVVEDILIQYYLLGRTYSQIGSLLFPLKAERVRCWTVHKGTRIGLAALASLLASGGTLPIAAAHSAPWTEMLGWVPLDSDRRRTIRLRAPRDLGDFVIVPNGQLAELFAPRWSVLGPSASGGAEV